MSDKSLIEKLIEKSPLAIVALGGMLFIFGSVGGWPSLNLQVKEMGWRVALGAMGAVVMAFGFLLLWRERTTGPFKIRSDFGIRIDAPKHGDGVGELTEVRGSYKKEPPQGALRLFVLSSDERNIWPQEEVRTLNKKEKKWAGRVHIGGTPNHNKIIRVAIIGQPTRIICDYYHAVGEQTKWQPIHEWPEEVVEYDSIVVTKI